MREQMVWEVCGICRLTAARHAEVDRLVLRVGWGEMG